MENRTNLTSYGQNIYPLEMTIPSMLIALFGVVGNGLLLLAIIFTKSLHNRCNILIATLAFVDFVLSIFFVELRFIILAGGFFWSNAKCYLWSAYGLFVQNVQSGLGLALGVDRLLAITKPVRYRTWRSRVYLPIIACPILLYATIVTFYGYMESSKDVIVPVCFPPFAYNAKGRLLWIGSNVVIVFLVLFAYGAAQYNIRRATNLSNASDVNLATTKHLLNSLTYIMIIYSASWAFTIFAMLLVQVIIPNTDLSRTLQTHLVWPVLVNTSSHFVIYAWRGQEYRQAFIRILTCGKFNSTNSFKPTKRVKKINHKLSKSNISLQNNSSNSAIIVHIPAVR